MDSEYSYLDDKIKKMIDSYIECNRDEITDIQTRKIFLSNIERYDFSSEELDYVMNYLAKEEIIVIGSVKGIYSDYENYKYQISGYNKGKNLKSKRLSNDEQIKLLNKYRKTNDKDILTELVIEYMPLVKLKALKYSKVYNMELDDLISSGYEGLLVAFNKFAFNTNSLISYVEKYVQGYIQSQFRFGYGLEHDPNYSYVSSARNEVKYSHYGENGYDEYKYIDDICTSFLEKSKYKDELKDIRMINMIYAVSLDEVEDSIAASDDISLYRETIEPLFQKQMSNYVSAMADGVLNDNQYFAVKYYHGIDEEKSYTLKELANWKECSYQAIHKDLNSAYEVMLDNWIDYMLEFYDNDNHEYDFNPGAVEYDRHKYKTKENTSNK